MDIACVWGLSHTPHGGVLFRKVRAITRVIQGKGRISAKGISSAERFSSRAVMPRFVCTIAYAITQGQPRSAQLPGTYDSTCSIQGYVGRGGVEPCSYLLSCW